MEPTVLDKIKFNNNNNNDNNENDNENNNNDNNNNNNEILNEIENESSNTKNSINKEKKLYKKYGIMIDKFEENILIEIEKYDNVLL